MLDIERVESGFFPMMPYRVMDWNKKPVSTLETYNQYSQAWTGQQWRTTKTDTSRNPGGAFPVLLDVWGVVNGASLLGT